MLNLIEWIKQAESPVDVCVHVVVGIFDHVMIAKKTLIQSPKAPEINKAFRNENFRLLEHMLLCVVPYHTARYVIDNKSVMTTISEYYSPIFTCHIEFNMQIEYNGCFRCHICILCFVVSII